MQRLDQAYYSSSIRGWSLQRGLQTVGHDIDVSGCSAAWQMTAGICLSDIKLDAVDDEVLEPTGILQVNRPSERIRSELCRLALACTVARAMAGVTPVGHERSVHIERCESPEQIPSTTLSMSIATARPGGLGVGRQVHVERHLVDPVRDHPGAVGQRHQVLPEGPAAVVPPQQLPSLPATENQQPCVRVDVAVPAGRQTEGARAVGPLMVG